MQEFIEKLIGRLEEESYTATMLTETVRYLNLQRTKDTIKELAEEYNNDMVTRLAMMYAKNLYVYGVDVTKVWETATQQTSALNQAYMRGRQDERDRFTEWQDEHNNGWISCSERLPDKRDWYLAVFQEVDTGFIGLPFIADYLMGSYTNFTTEDGWIIANCTDIEEDRAEYYKKLKCIAWQPLPPKYEPKGE